MRATAKTIVMVVLPGVQLLDVAGPLDVFAEANAQADHEVYSCPSRRANRVWSAARQACG